MSVVEKVAVVTPLQTVAEQQVDIRLSSDRVKLQTATNDSVFTSALPSHRLQYDACRRSEGQTSSLISRPVFEKNRSVVLEEPKISSNALLYRVHSNFNTNSKLLLNSSNEEYNKSSTDISIGSHQFIPVENQKILVGSSRNCEKSSIGRIFSTDSFNRKTRPIENLISNCQLTDNCEPQCKSLETYSVDNNTPDSEVSTSITHKIMPSVERTSPELCTSKDSAEKYISNESMATSNWDPTLLLNKLYEVTFKFWNFYIIRFIMN